jgi:hypothetical protein
MGKAGGGLWLGIRKGSRPAAMQEVRRQNAARGSLQRAGLTHDGIPGADVTDNGYRVAAQHGYTARMHKSAATITVTFVFAYLAGCASTGKALAQLEPGMPKTRVVQIAGEPADRSFRGTDEAWQYQELVGFGQCKYTTVWIEAGKLVGVSTRRGTSVAGCGLGSREVDWSQMPSSQSSK